jgi:hypothetical protein
MGKFLAIALVVMTSSAADALVRCEYFIDPDTGQQVEICYQEYDEDAPGVPDNCQVVDGKMYCN